MISYEPLWRTLSDKHINMTEMRKLTGIATATMAKLKKNESLTLAMIDKICSGLNCNIENVVEIKSCEQFNLKGENYMVTTDKIKKELWIDASDHFLYYETTCSTIEEAQEELYDKLASIGCCADNFWCNTKMELREWHDDGYEVVEERSY